MCRWSDVTCMNVAAWGLMFKVYGFWVWGSSERGLLPSGSGRWVGIWHQGETFSRVWGMVVSHAWQGIYVCVCVCVCVHPF